MAWLFSATSGVLALLLAGLLLLGWGCAGQFGPYVAAMITGGLLVWAGLRAARWLK